MLVGIGDTIVAEDWAEKEYPFPSKPALKGLSEVEALFEREEYREAKRAVLQKRDNRAGLYAIYLGARRCRLRGADEGWVEWLSMITVPAAEDDQGEASEAVEPGEAAGPPSAA